MPLDTRFALARRSIESLSSMLVRVDNGMETEEDESALRQFEAMVRDLADDDDDPRIKRAILDAARAEMERQGGESLRPDLRVITGEGGA